MPHSPGHEQHSRHDGARPHVVPAHARLRQYFERHREDRRHRGDREQRPGPLRQRAPSDARGRAAFEIPSSRPPAARRPRTSSTISTAIANTIAEAAARAPYRPAASSSFLGTSTCQIMFKHVLAASRNTPAAAPERRPPKRYRADDRARPGRSHTRRRPSRAARSPRPSRPRGSPG